MKLRTRIFTILALVALSLSAMAKDIDVKKSTLKWTGEKVSGEHWGNIKIKSGNLKLKKGKITGGEFTVDMTTITTGDLEGEWAQKLVGHLNNEDFFKTSEYKTSKLVITSAKEVKPNFYELKGDLTIKDKTHLVTFNAKLKNGNYEGRLVFDRTKYGVKYGSGSYFSDLGDKMIYDDVKLDFNIALK